MSEIAILLHPRRTSKGFCPFLAAVGTQVKICEAFDFPIPNCCAPVYVSKAKQTTRRRGRPAKPKVEKQTF